MNSSPPNPPLAIWGGVECSCVRTAHGVYDQQARTGHLERDGDLKRFAALGLKTMRVPILWDHHPDGSGEAGDGWVRTDRRMNRLRELGIRPIVGLLHHGCGPLPGGFEDPDFVDGLARFARRVAERYPWVDAYTPVNEPLTTARFSGLYGIWHPFARDERTFLALQLRQCAAVRAAMREIRRVNPGAQLVQTEDLGKTHSTPALEHQAEFENERRWFTWDLLAGRVVSGNRMHAHLRYLALPEATFASFADEPCPPEIFGMNYYVTSERLLDERLERYPAAYHGGNGVQAYADVPAVRARAEGLAGTALPPQETWQRYRRPIAITEVQLACTRDEQLRWLEESWAAAGAARESGVDVRAVTVWALLGAYDWNSLLMHPVGHYECGAFDVRRRRPRRTALATAVAGLAARGNFSHPAAGAPGWWRRPERLLFAPVSAPRTGPGTAVPGWLRPAPPVAIVGASRELAAAFQAVCRLRALPAVFAADEVELLRQEPAHAPWALIHPESLLHAWGVDRILELAHHALDDEIDALREPRQFGAA